MPRCPARSFSSAASSRHPSGDAAVIRPLALLASLLLATPAVAEDCHAALTELRLALPTAPLDQLTRFQRERVDPVCTGPEGAAAARSVALRHAHEALRAAQSGAPLDQRIALLRAGLAVSAEPWQLHELLGDALQATEDFAGAALHYQLAMNALHGLAPGLQAPPPEHLRALIAKAQQARQLAPVLIALPATRDGTPGGLGLRSLRGIAVEAVAQPLHFHTDSTELTPLGQEAFRQLLDLLREEGNPRITLVGHTDERGSDAHNDALSLRRAQRIAELLVAAGYAREAIRVEGRGKRQPFRVVTVQGVTYSREQRWQMDRRVELVR